MRNIIFLCFMLLVFAGCNTIKYLPPAEKYLDGAKVVVNSKEPVEGESELNSELSELLRPQPNTAVFGLRFGVWAYFRGPKKNKADTSAINKFILKKYAIKPSYLSDVDTSKTKELINNRLENRGFFYSRIRAEVKEYSTKAGITYHVELPQPYILDSMNYLLDSSDLTKEIVRMAPEALLRRGQRFDLELLKQERERIDTRLKNLGYYFFQPDNLLFRMDTNQKGTHKFHLYLSLKANVPPENYRPYRVDKITVFPDFAINDSNFVAKDSTVTDSIIFIQNGVYFKPELLEDYILIRKGNLYSKRKENLTSSRLGSIGNYRYVNIRFRKVDDDSSKTGRLHAEIFLSPLNKRALREEMQALSKSNNFVGPSFLVSYKDRNVFKGGETFSLSGKIGYETQIAGGRQTGLSSYETGLQADLIFPRLLGFPNLTGENFVYGVPRTTMGAGFSVINRVQFYRLNSFSLSYAFSLNTSRLISHELTLPSITYAGLSKTSPQFDTILLSNPFLRRSFEQQFIVGLKYNFQFNQLLLKNRKNRFLFLLGIDAAGNTISWLQNAEQKSKQELFSQPYARYVRLDADLRHYFKVSANSQLVTRVFAGFGMPFGNSSSLPYIKQYFAGGPNSIRGFRIRSLGPGIYAPPELNVSSYYDQAGDIKFESNIEYRFPIVAIFKGALFADAGNVWLYNENPTLPGGQFSNKWFSELAVGTGFGLRVDLEFLVIRLDIATPLRKPFLPENERWVSEFKLGYKSWRKENLIFNIAIGYPF